MTCDDMACDISDDMTCDGMTCDDMTCDDMACHDKYCVVPQKDTGVSKHVDSLNINILNDYIKFIF